MPARRDDNLERDQELYKRVALAAMTSVQRIAAADEDEFVYGLCCVIAQLHEHLSLSLLAERLKRTYLKEANATSTGKQKQKSGKAPLSRQ